MIRYRSGSRLFMPGVCERPERTKSGTDNNGAGLPSDCVQSILAVQNSQFFYIKNPLYIADQL